MTSARDRNSRRDRALVGIAGSARSGHHGVRRKPRLGSCRAPVARDGLRLVHASRTGHPAQMHRYCRGKPIASSRGTPDRVFQRAMHAQRDPVFGCVIAAGRRDRDGYVLVGRDRAHISAWILARGPVPAGLELDHLCRRRACSAVYHLEPITRSEQEKRKSWRYRARIATCPAGHEMRDALVTPEGGRLCRQCHNEHRRAA